MERKDIEGLLDQLATEGVRDVRGNPDPNRRGQFLSGWRDNSERSRHCGAQVLRQLTWHNLGWRLARIHHDPAGIDKREVYDLYELAEAIWWQDHP